MFRNCPGTVISNLWVNRLGIGAGKRGAQAGLRSADHVRKQRKVNFLLGIILLAILHGTSPSWAAEESHWVATWAASAMPMDEDVRNRISDFEEMTVRQVVRTSIGGDSVRLFISNVFGESSLRLSEVSVAIQSEGADIEIDSLQLVTFAGAGSVDVPKGSFIYSDPVPLAAHAFSNLAVSMFVKEAPERVTQHGAGAEITYVSGTGNFTREQNFPVIKENTRALFLTGVEVSVEEDTKLVVCFGDSITIGTNADSGNSWPDFLAQRLSGEAAVLNQGIAGNRLLRDYAGESGLKRFDRDVLAWNNLTHVIVLLGTNDLGYTSYDSNVFPAGVDAPRTVATGEIIAAYRELITRAHDKGVQIIGATLPPFEGSGHFSNEAEEQRQAINTWIRESREFDGVIDFDLVLRDPASATRLKSEYHEEDDWLHPNGDGYSAMADNVDLTLFE
jgi:lysophospholipase L1-like esterase